MLNKKTAVTIVVMALLATACQSKQEKLKTQIAQKEAEMENQYDVAKMDSLLTLYWHYCKEFPQDSLTEEYLFRSGTTNMSLRKGEEAMGNFIMLVQQFPHSKYLPEVYYYRGFIFEDILYDIASAEEAYHEFIRRYPSHKLVTDATLSIQYLGKSSEEIISSFEQKEDTITLVNQN
jgi:outer membrane protein assembly factor BamD (BamD/ComL family)